MTIDKLISQLENQRRKVDFDTYDVIVEQLVLMVGSSSIDVAPTYQRQFRWDNSRRCQLIESVFLGVPVPSLFMATNRDGTWELVDGVQRLSTIVQFSGSESVRQKLGLDKPLVLSNLEKLSEFNGLAFDDLPKSLQLQFWRRPIKVITLSDKSDTMVRFDLFERLNTGGIALTNQEIRACIFRGEFNDFLCEMSRYSDFRKVLRLTKKQEQDATLEEYVLRFFAFMDRYKHFEHSVLEFLNGYMRDSAKSFNYKANREIFKRTFSQLAMVFPDGILRTPGRGVTSVNLFEGVAVGAALALREKDKLLGDDVATWITSPDLKRFTSGGTNNRSMVVGRIEYCRDRFL